MAAMNDPGPSKIAINGPPGLGPMMARADQLLQPRLVRGGPPMAAMNDPGPSKIAINGPPGLGPTMARADQLLQPRLVRGNHLWQP